MPSRAWFSGLLPLGLVLCQLITCQETSTPALAYTPPNYMAVDDALVRSGQPTTTDQWAFLRADLDRLAPGRQHYVIKLNFPDEGSDDGALKAGFIVITIAIQPAGDRDIFDDILNTFVKPSAGDLESIESAINAHRFDGEVVHCTHGQDRTGLAIARDRVIHYGWPKQRARDEWLSVVGFPPHPIHGLDDTWEDWRPSTSTTDGG